MNLAIFFTSLFLFKIIFFSLLVLPVAVFIYMAMPYDFSAKDKISFSSTQKTFKTLANNEVFTVYCHNSGFFAGMNYLSSVGEDCKDISNLPIRIDQTRWQANLQAEADKIKMANIALCQEIDLGGNRSHDLNSVQILNDKAEVNFANFASYIYSNINYVPVPLKNPMGSVLSSLSTFSQYEIAKQEACVFRQARSVFNPLYYGYPRYSAHAVTLNLGSGRQLVCINVHLDAESPAVRQKQIQDLLDFAAKFKDKPIIIAGDFNTDPYMDDETITKMLKGGFKLASELGQANGENLLQDYTYPSDLTLDNGAIKNGNDYIRDKFCIKISTLDYIFYTPNSLDYVDKSFKVVRDLHSSDHFPIQAQFRLKPIKS